MRRLVPACLVSLACACSAHAAVPPGFVGLYSDDGFYGDAGYRLSEMETQARLGVGTVRQPFEWWRVETRPGRFDFTPYDGYVADAARAGLSVLPVLIAPPAFRSSRPRGSRSHAMYPPRRFGHFARFAAAAVRRYGPDGSFWVAHPEVPYVPIHSWQVWNEPNIPNFWRSGPSARRYVALLRVTSAAIRAADPAADVVAAGLPNSNLGVPFLHYLRAMYGAGARGLFDTLAIHPYARSAEGMLRLTEQARAVMNRAGDEARLWITEFGWSTGGDASAFRVGATGQANRIALAVSGLAAERRALRLRGFVLFKWRDSTAPPGGVGRGDPWPLHTGLLAADAIPKPSFWTFARVVQSLASDTPASPGSAALTQISRRDVRLSPLGNAAVVLGCASAAVDACQGRLTLRSARPAGCGGAQLGRGAHIGVARFRIGAPPALAPVPLSHASVALARCAGSLRVRASAAASRAVEFTLRAR